MIPFCSWGLTKLLSGSQKGSVFRAPRRVLLPSGKAEMPPGSKPAIAGADSEPVIGQYISHLFYLHYIGQQEQAAQLENLLEITSPAPRHRITIIAHSTRTAGNGAFVQAWPKVATLFRRNSDGQRFEPEMPAQECTRWCIDLSYQRMVIEAADELSRGSAPAAQLPRTILWPLPRLYQGFRDSSCIPNGRPEARRGDAPAGARSF
jgi:hypothetical protein